MKTCSWSFPNCFNVAQNQVGVLEDEVSVVNRSRLLILTEPTEIYNEPNQGVGLRRHLWQYNNDNQKALILDRIKAQLRLHEPQCLPDLTQYSDGNIFTGSNETNIMHNELKMTVAIKTVFGSTVDLEFNEAQRVV